MSGALRPPDDVFCMQCGPGVVLEPGDDPGLLHCERCGASRWVPGYPLFLVTGTSGAGKTTVVQPLGRILPECVVLDVDVILHVAAMGWETWRNTLLQLANAHALGGRATVLCGSMLPEDLTELPARRLIGPIHCCTLYCPDSVLVERLRQRPAWRGSGDEEFIANQLKFAAALRARISPAFESSGQSAEELAERIAAWVRPLLPTHPPVQPEQEGLVG